MIELEPERGDEGDVVEEGVARVADEVRRNAPAGEERSEVDRRALNGGIASTRPFDLGDLEPFALCRLRDRLGLEHVRIERRRAVPERLAVDVEGVVRGAVDRGPGT